MYLNGGEWTVRVQIGPHRAMLVGGARRLPLRLIVCKKRLGIQKRDFIWGWIFIVSSVNVPVPLWSRVIIVYNEFCRRKSAIGQKTSAK